MIIWTKFALLHSVSLRPPFQLDSARPPQSNHFLCWSGTFVTTLDTILIYIQKLCRRKYISHVAVESLNGPMQGNHFSACGKLLTFHIQFPWFRFFTITKFAFVEALSWELSSNSSSVFCHYWWLFHQRSIFVEGSVLFLPPRPMPTAQWHWFSLV